MLVFACVAQAGVLRYCGIAPTEMSLTNSATGCSASLSSGTEPAGQPASRCCRARASIFTALGERYSHAGVTLLASAMAPWSVRQL